MSDFSSAINLICKYEGFNEKAYPDPVTGAEPYTIGYGTQFYPDGSPVKKSQLCSKEKALEYLFHEVNLIDAQLAKLNLGLNRSMQQALISFVHSIGWEPFLYSSIIDHLERDDLKGVAEELGRWVYDSDHQLIGNLLERRKEEVDLLLAETEVIGCLETEILMTAFRSYTAAPHQVKAIRELEKSINPYLLSAFANKFKIDEDPWGGYTNDIDSWDDYLNEDFNTIFDR